MKNIPNLRKKIEFEVEHKNQACLLVVQGSGRLIIEIEVEHENQILLMNVLVLDITKVKLDTE